MFIYSLRAKKQLDHPDGRIFLPGHDANQLNKAEVLELISNFPDHFEAADEITRTMLAETQIPPPSLIVGGDVSYAGTLDAKKVAKK